VQKIYLARSANVQIAIHSFQDNKGSDNYAHFGTVLPVATPGSQNYFRAKWQDLKAIITHIGPPQFFITLSANDQWPGRLCCNKANDSQGLQRMLGNVPVIQRPVEATRYFYARFSIILPLLTG